MSMKVMVCRGMLVLLGVVGAALAAGMLIVQASIGVCRGGDSVAVLGTLPQTSETYGQNLVFPYCLEQNLWLELVTGYEGLYLEDGSMEPVSDVAAILLYNAGSEMLEDVEIILETEDGEMVFTGTYLPPGQRTMILAQEKAVYTNQKIQRAEAKVDIMEKATTDDVAISDWEGAGLKLENVSSHLLRDITVFYKTYYEEWGFYLGGLTYQAYAGSLEPGESIALQLPNYASGYSRVLAVVTEMP